MRKFVLFVFILCSICVQAQRQNTFYVTEFPGATVGAKTANALASCMPSAAVPCFIIVDPTLATWPKGTMPTIPANVVLQDYRTGLVFSPLQTTNTIQTTPNASDGTNLIPFGNDLIMNGFGAADTVVQANQVATNGLTSVTAGTRTVTTADNPQKKFYLGASIIINRFKVDEESIAGGAWTMSATGITAPFALAHTAPYTVDQWGSVDVRSWLTRQQASDGTVLWSRQIKKTSGGAWQYMEFFNNNLALFQIMATDYVPRHYGGPSGAGMVFYGSNGAAGTSGVFRFRNNAFDDSDKCTIDAGSGNITCNRFLTPVGTVVDASNKVLAAGGIVSGNAGQFTVDTAGNVTSSGTVQGSHLDANGKALAYPVAKLALTGQTANIGGANIYAVTATGTYRVSWMIYTQVAGSAGTVYGTIGYNTLPAQTMYTNTATINLNSTAQVGQSAYVLHAVAGTNITYSATVAGAVGSPQYGWDVVVERLQ